MMKMARPLALTVALALMTGAAHAQSMTLQVSRDYYLVHGDKALMKGDMAAAARYFRQALGKNLTDAERVSAHNSLCAAEFSLGHYGAAKKACTAAIKADRGYWKAYVNRGNAQRALGDKEAALADYCAAHALEPRKVKGPFVHQCPA
ncbi:hypothetical protein [Kordiimonas marina]|uniref:hypothetical protein n=1 Tax=Kordiimonas marina TaxID=2872312 RepID=UPI001FF27492|nr:hypothetical protein [Kordiimonas marina]MCJ9429537.1 hypothetical protein [Kordiimonas marina]